jgi:hypothetical protein
LRGIPRGEKELVKDGIDGLKFRTLHIWPRDIGYVEGKPEIVEGRPVAATSVSRDLLKGRQIHAHDLASSDLGVERKRNCDDR